MSLVQTIASGFPETPHLQGETGIFGVLCTFPIWLSLHISLTLWFLMSLSLSSTQTTPNKYPMILSVLPPPYTTQLARLPHPAFSNLYPRCILGTQN